MRLIGKAGRVTGLVADHTTGAVTISGMEYLARPYTPGEEFPRGTSVVVVDYEPPLTVYVGHLNLG